MWEVRAADGQLAELLAWLLPRLDAGAQIYRSAAGEPRVVVIDPTGTADTRLADVPAGLIARPAHAWNFEPVRND
jgi:MoxR-like ATPase